ncbi:hypothetical protein E2C01_081850 [Portunus trituberculatus]|uniref:Uncharacterized protein n=1 Tax=Portunus trituberculatus TaxID=210409 RepID=A0A5B7ISY3_PORTR|nr:hypothetical protein [Portunus trituberculatus]
MGQLSLPSGASHTPGLQSHRKRGEGRLEVTKVTPEKVIAAAESCDPGNLCLAVRSPWTPLFVVNFYLFPPYLPPFVSVLVTRRLPALPSSAGTVTYACHFSSYVRVLKLSPPR